MSGSMLWRLVRKDLYFNRALTAGSVVLGLVALTLISFGNAAGYVALILLITAIIIQGVFVCMNAIAGERKEKALWFGLSFPISTGQYRAAKAIAAIASFLLPWVTIALGGFVALRVAPIAHGLIPVSVLTWLFVFDEFCLILGITLCTDSEAWTSVTIVWISTSISLFFYFVLRVHSIQANLYGPRAVWNSTVIAILAGEIGVIVLIGALVSYRLARQRDFI
jgi:hypothetical protein